MFISVVFTQFACTLVLPWLLKEHRWRLYLRVGADPGLRAMYMRYLVVISLVKILLLLSIIDGTSSGMGIQDKSIIIILDVFHWATTLGFAILTALAFRYEWKICAWGALLLALYAPGYIVFWIYDIVTQNQLYEPDYAPRALAISFLVSASLTLLVQPVTAILLCVQYTQFGNGFKSVFEDAYKPLPIQTSDQS